jgi:hypothetical protein
MTRVQWVGTGVILTGALIVGLQRPADAQARAADVESPEAIVNATYDAIGRAPGAQFAWDRFRSLFLPSANLIPNTEQTGGPFRVMTVEDFITWIDNGTQIGGPNDQGFQEEAVANHIEHYGDIAHVFSVYQKHFWGSDQILGRGINTFQLVHHEGRWWIAGIAWDEETSGIAIPERYLR